MNGVDVELEEVLGEVRAVEIVEIVDVVLLLLVDMLVEDGCLYIRVVLIVADMTVYMVLWYPYKC